MNREAMGNELRCKAGDLARVVRSSNRALMNRIVKIARLHGDGRWECVLIGDAVLGLADDGDGLVLTRDWLFPDACLEPRFVGRKSTSAAFAEALLC
jgi:hypothetical protein